MVFNYFINIMINMKKTHPDIPELIIGVLPSGKPNPWVKLPNVSFNNPPKNPAPPVNRLVPGKSTSVSSLHDLPQYSPQSLIFLVQYG